MGVALDLTGLVLRDATLKVVRVPEVVRAVGTAQHVDEEGFHGCMRPFDRLRANGARPIILSLSKDRLDANGAGRITEQPPS